MTGVGSGILGGIVAWFATMLVGQPLYQLINLRSQTAWLLHFYDPLTHDDRVLSALWVSEREKAYRDHGAKLLVPGGRLRARQTSTMATKRRWRNAMDAGRTWPRGG